MKILQIITELDYGGAERLLLNACCELVSRGHVVYVVQLTGNASLQKDFEACGCFVSLFAIGGRLGILTAGFKLAGFIRKERFDVVHTHLSQAGFVGRMAAMLAGCRNIVHTVHGIYIHWLQQDSFLYGMLRKIDTWLGNRRGAKVIAISRAVNEFLLKREPRLNPNHVHIFYNAISFGEIDRKVADTDHQWNSVPNHVDVQNNEPFKNDAAMLKQVSLEDERVSWEKPEKSEEKRIGFFHLVCIGRMTPEKGHNILIKALEELICGRKITKISCYFIGDGPLRQELEQIVHQSGLDEHILFVGQTDNPYCWLKTADALVIPSISEGFGIVALEGFYCGVPVVASDTEGLRELVRDGETGLLAEAGNPLALADKIMAAYNRDEAVWRIVDNARVFVRQFGIDRYVDDLLGLYRRQ